MHLYYHKGGTHVGGGLPRFDNTLEFEICYALLNTPNPKTNVRKIVNCASQKPL